MADEDRIDLPPIVDDIGVMVVEHGERGDLDSENPEACLCGRYEPYYMCDGPGVESLTLGGPVEVTHG